MKKVLGPKVVTTVAAAEGALPPQIQEALGELARRRIEALRRLDAEIRQLEREIAQSVQASGSGLPQLVGISYLGAARIIGEVGDVGRIPTKARFARRARASRGRPEEQGRPSPTVGRRREGEGTWQDRAQPSRCPAYGSCTRGARRAPGAA